MKILGLLLFFVVLSTTYALRCWECPASFSNAECLRRGNVRRCSIDQDACEDQVRHVMGGRMTIIEKRCKQRHACQNNFNQNQRRSNPVQCEPKPGRNSVCTCCCSRDRCNRDLATCFGGSTPINPARGRDCPGFPVTPEYAVMQCQGNKEPGTECEFKCNSGFFMRGRGKTSCLPNGEWEYQPPRCVEKTCRPPLRAPGNGSMTCTDGNKLRSQCRFTCNRDYALVGSANIQCLDVNFTPGSRYGIWSSRNAPRCRPLFCPFQTPLYHATMSCSRGDRLDSTCSFRCPTGFEIFPHDIPGKDFSRTRCMPNGQWDTPFPCCHLPCPPFATVDFFLVLDSSSSVELANWNLMKRFVLTMLSRFIVREDAAQYSAFRYNSIVDTDTQIFLNSTSSHAGFIEAFNRLPYNGDGTNTGNALDHLRNNVLNVGNREVAPDVVLLITDGESQDRVGIAARRLRDEGVVLLVLPVQREGGDAIDLSQIEQIAGPGNDRNILRNALEGGFAALDEEFARELSGFLCPAPCANPFHVHPGEIPTRLEEYIPSHPLHK